MKENFNGVAGQCGGSRKGGQQPSMSVLALQVTDSPFGVEMLGAQYIMTGRAGHAVGWTTMARWEVR